MLYGLSHGNAQKTTALLMLCVPVIAFQKSCAQAASATGSGERLAQLVAAEKSAVDAGDPGVIQSSGRELGTLALVLLGRLYDEQGRCAQASEAYERSLQVEDSSARPEDQVQTRLLLLGSDLCANRPEAAQAAAEQVVKLAGDSAQTHLLMANAYHAGNDLEGTIRELNRALKADPQFGAAHLGLGNAYWELNEYQYNPDTLHEFTTAQRLRPDDPFANQSLGFILSQYERYQEAEGYLIRATEENPASPDPWLQLGMNAYATKQYSEAAVSLNRAMELTGANVSRNGYQIRRAYAVMSRIESKQGHVAEAEQFDRREKAIRSLIQQDNTAIPLTESASTPDGSGPNLADKAATRAAAAPTSQQQRLEQQLKEIAASSLNDAGTALARGRDYQAALPLFRIASVANPGLPPVMRNLGLAAFHTGDYADAAQALAVALEQNPEDALVRVQLEKARALMSARKP